MKKILNTLKWVVVVILIIIVSIRVVYVDSVRKEHLLTCKETYKIRVKTLFSWYDTITCHHYN